MTYNLPAHGETDWDTKLNASLDTVKATADAAETPTGAQAKADAAQSYSVQRAHHTGTQASSTISDFTAAAQTAARPLDDAATLRQAFGSTGGQPMSPWQASPVVGPEFWALANFQSGGGYNSTTLTPSLTANGTEMGYKTRVNLGNLVNNDLTWRIEFDYSISGINAGGAAQLSMLLTDSTGALVAGTAEQIVVNQGSPKLTGHYVFDFKPTGMVGGTYFELREYVWNNATTGTVSVSNVTLKMTGDLTPPMLVSPASGTTAPYVYWNQRGSAGGRLVAKTIFDDDGALTAGALSTVVGFSDPQPWRYDQPDPYFLNANSGVVGSQEETSTGNNLRVKNNDQIIEVWNGTAWELRGNTHGGETLRAAGVSFKVDRGAGLVAWTSAHGLEPVRRFQVTTPTQITLSTGGAPIINVDHVMTVYPDGVTRMDRTTTFLADVPVRNHFEWMSSHDTTTPYLGRIGKGLDPIAEVDTHPRIGAPSGVGVTTSTTGGTLAAATYSYRVAALTSYGESLASTAVTVTTTGTTSSNTVSWSAASFATGYAIYGRTAGVERLLATTAALSWVDTGSAASSTPPKTVNTARVYNNSLTVGSIHSTDATWAVWYEPRTGWCQANIYDRESTLARANVADVRTRLEAGSGIQKNYASVYWTGGVESLTIPTGTSWTATHYSMTYQPFSPDQYHREASLRAANLAALGTLYPNS